MASTKNNSDEKLKSNKAIVARWFTEYWGPVYNPAIVEELAAPDIRFDYSLHPPCQGRDEVRSFGHRFRAAFPDLSFSGVGELIAEGDYVVGRWFGGGTQSGAEFTDLRDGKLPAKTGKSAQWGGTTVLKVVDGMITEEIGLEDGVTALRQLGLI